MFSTFFTHTVRPKKEKLTAEAVAAADAERERQRLEREVVSDPRRPPFLQVQKCLSGRVRVQCSRFFERRSCQECFSFIVYSRTRSRRASTRENPIRIACATNGYRSEMVPAGVHGQNTTGTTGRNRGEIARRESVRDLHARAPRPASFSI